MSYEAELLVLLLRLNCLAGYVARSQFDAVAVFPGIGEGAERINAGIRLAEHKNAKALLVLGVHPSEKIDGGGRWTVEAVTNQCVVILGHAPQFEVIAQVNTFITPGQVEYLLDWVNTRPDVSNILLVAGGWHIPRATLTTIKDALKRYELGQRLPILIPCSGMMNLQGTLEIINDHGDGSQLSAVEGEVRRMLTYQAKGDVATLDEFERYVQLIGA